jgi:hypothetical protein
MADYEGGKVDGVGRTLGGVALGGAGLSLIGGFLNSALQNVAGYIGSAIRGGGPVPFGGYGHPGFAAPVGFAAPMPVPVGPPVGFGLEHENTALRIENAKLQTEAKIALLEKELAFEKERRTHGDMDALAFVGSHYVPGRLVMPASHVVTTTPVTSCTCSDGAAPTGTATDVKPM